VQPLLKPCENGYVLFDDTVLDKRYSTSIELTRRQYSGNEHRVIRGIGLISCVYVNGETGQFWVIDYRLYDLDGDGQSKLDHVAAMLNGAVYSKSVPFATVLMDSWYATQSLMAQIDQLGKVYFCPLKVNRRVDDSGATQPYRRIDELGWTVEELHQGKLVKIRGFPKHKKVKLFRVTVSTHRTEFVVTNDLSQASVDAVQDVSGIRWKIEEFHRELKQLTGVEACECRKARIQRNHIACALLVWSRRKTIAYRSSRTIYQIKQGMLSDYLIAQLKHPSVQMSLA
jgi:Transposase DDE domain